MRTYSLAHLSDRALLRDLAALVSQDRATTAALLAHLAEVDARKLYLPAAHPSMYSYCVHELRLSEDAAAKRIQAARVARRFPAIFEAVAEGRVHLSGVCLLAPHLREDNADELLAAATHRTKAEIERLVAERSPRPDVFAWAEAIPGAATAASEERHAPGHVVERTLPEPAPAQHAPGHVDRSRVKPLSPRSFAVQFTMSRRAYDLLGYAQALLGHQVPTGDVAAVVERALEALVGQLEKQKFAATSRPRRNGRRSKNPRHIPAQVKRAVWARDGGQCTFVTEAGRRCPARTRLEFDHIEPVARGGQATVAGLRVRCRAHNQYAAECAFGTAFMSHKRREAQRAAAAARAAAAERAPEGDVVPWLRQLGFRADEARRAAARCEAIPEAGLEERVRLALRFLSPPHRRVATSTETPT